MGKVYDEQLISSTITSLKSAEEILDSSCQSLESIVNSEGYYSDLKTGVINLKELLTVHGEFSKFVSNAKALYDVVCGDIKQSVDDISTSNIDIIYDTLLLDYGMVDQKDPRWKDLRYGSGTIGGGGCGPSSVANALIITFGITDPNKVKSLLLECVSLGGAGSTVSDYLVGKSKRNNKYSTLNSIIDNAGGPIYYMGGSGNKVLEYIQTNPPKDGQKVYLIGKMAFQSGGRNDSSYGNIINITNALYKTAPNTNITFFGMAGGTGGRAFGSKSDSGHYVGLLINVKDFKENGSVYLLDSYPRRLPGEANNSQFWGDYNFTAKPNYGDFKKVNSSFTFTRISRDIVKIQVKGGGAFDTEHLRLLGLSGGTHLVTSPGNAATSPVTPKKEKTDYSAKYDETLQGQLPTFSATTDTREDNNRARTMASASREARQAANTAQTNQITVEPLTQPSRLTGDLSNVPTEEKDNVVPEEYEFPKETEQQLKASGDQPEKQNKGKSEKAEEKPKEPKVPPKEEDKTVTAKEETTTVPGVMPAITATNSTSQTPVTTSSRTQVTVTGNTNPNGYSMPTDNKTPTTPNTSSSPSSPGVPSSNTTKMTASAGVSDIRFSSSEASNPTSTPSESSMTASAQQTVEVDQNAVNNAAVNETVVAEETKKDNDNSNKRKTTVAIAGASLLVAGTTALLLNSNPKNYKVELIGEPEVSISMNQNYSDPGCKVLEGEKELDLKANVKMNLDITTPGTYKMTCSINDDAKTRYINVNQDNDNDTVGNVNIFYNESNVLPTKYDDTETTVDTTYTIRYNDNVDYIKYCVSEYGEKCTPSGEEKHNNDTFKINETGKRVIYIEKYSDGSMVKEVRYINIK